MSKYIPRGLGWHRDLPDPRDYTPKHDYVVRLLHDLDSTGDRPKAVDLREYCAEVEDQQALATSTVSAAVAMVRYFQRRATGGVLEPSRMFVYRTARRLNGWVGDSGLPCRTTLKAIAKYGLPPESMWPYEASRLDREPDAFVFASARSLGPLTYVRLDARGERPENALETVRRFLAAGFVSQFGFPVCTSLTCDAEIPFPTIFDSVRGGQAVLTVGYDDNRRVRSDKGALLIANSWGPEWGDGGYGWLPYSYVREQFAADFWTVLAPEWLSSGEFQRPE
jgi:C1A family cysteine protease